MDDKQLIEALGGQSATARRLNKVVGADIYTRYRVYQWATRNRIPPYEKLRFARIWKLAEKDAKT